LPLFFAWPGVGFYESNVKDPVFRHWKFGLVCAYGIELRPRSRDFLIFHAFLAVADSQALGNHVVPLSNIIPREPLHMSVDPGAQRLLRNRRILALNRAMFLSSL
jgi:hypothetical protein